MKYPGSSICFLCVLCYCFLLFTNSQNQIQTSLATKAISAKALDFAEKQYLVSSTKVGISKFLPLIYPRQLPCNLFGRPAMLPMDPFHATAALRRHVLRFCDRSQTGQQISLTGAFTVLTAWLGLKRPPFLFFLQRCQMEWPHRGKLCLLKSRSSLQWCK